MLQKIHHRSAAAGWEAGEGSESFSDSNGVRQSCVLAPRLYSLMFSAIPTDALSGMGIGIGM